MQFGVIVLTTSSGIMDHEEARRKKVGGKVSLGVGPKFYTNAPLQLFLLLFGAARFLLQLSVKPALSMLSLGAGAWVLLLRAVPLHRCNRALSLCRSNSHTLCVCLHRNRTLYWKMKTKDIFNRNAAAKRKTSNTR